MNKNYRLIVTASKQPQAPDFASIENNLKNWLKEILTGSKDGILQDGVEPPPAAGQENSSGV